MRPQLLLADEFPLTHKWLKTFLQSYLAVQEVPEVSSSNELMRQLIKVKFTHLILDIILSDGSTLEILPNIRMVYPELRIMVFSRNHIEVYGKALKQFDIHYYLPKDSSELETLRVLKQFLVIHEPSAISNPLIKIKPDPFSMLPPRQLEVLQHMLRGDRTKMIADTMGIKMNSVSSMKNQIFEKTGTSTLVQLLELAALYNVLY